MHRRSTVADMTPWFGLDEAHDLVLEGGRAALFGSNRSVRGKQDWWVGGPDRPRARAEQCSREGLCLEQGRGWAGVSRMVCAMCERVADGGGCCCCHCCQVSRYDLCSQRLTLVLLTQGQLYRLFGLAFLRFAVGTVFRLGWFTRCSVFMTPTADMLF